MKACLCQPCGTPEGKRLVKGYCDKHYKRIERHGDPLYVTPGGRFEKGRKVNHPIFIKHGNLVGRKKSATYHSWQSMKTRCENPHAANYPRYGGKGISYCERWAVFANFLEDMGVRPDGTSLDRIDSNGNYEPGNCRWATYKIQARNSGRRKV